MPGMAGCGAPKVTPAADEDTFSAPESTPTPLPEIALPESTPSETPESVPPESVPSESVPSEFPSQAGEGISRLKTALQNELDRLDGEWDLWVEDLESGESIHCTRNLNGPMVSASLIKLFIMGAVYEQIERGALAEADVWDALYSMITISDNTAANRLTRLLGGGDPDAGRNAVNVWAASIGCPEVRHNRLMLQENGLENYNR